MNCDFVGTVTTKNGECAFGTLADESLWKQHEFNYFEIYYENRCVLFCFVFFFLLYSSFINNPVSHFNSVVMILFSLVVVCAAAFFSILHHIAIRVSMRKFQTSRNTNQQNEVERKKKLIEVMTICVYIGHVLQ